VRRQGHPNRLVELKAGNSPIYEPGLDDLLVLFTDDLAGAVKGADIVLLAVGTPIRRGDGHATMTCQGPLLARLVGALFELLIPANQVDVVVGD
jgi:UDP-glucose 6-dehydrogenase